MPAIAIPERIVRMASAGILGIVCLTFLMPYLGIQYNTDNVKKFLGPLATTSSSATNTTSQCLDALNGQSVATYSGVGVALGGSPAFPSAPSACGSHSAITVSGTNADEQKIGWQPWQILGVLCVALGIAAAFASDALAPMAIAVSSLSAFALFLVAKAHTADVALATSVRSSGQISSNALGEEATLLKFTLGAGLEVALVLLLIVALLNIGAGLAPALRR